MFLKDKNVTVYIQYRPKHKHRLSTRVGKPNGHQLNPKYCKFYVKLGSGNIMV